MRSGALAPQPSVGLQRTMGVTTAAIGAATLVMATVQEPITRWNGDLWSRALPLVLAMVFGVYVLVTGRYFQGAGSGKTRHVLNWLLFVIGGLLLAGTVVWNLSTWNASATIMSGVWVIILVYAAVDLIQLRIMRSD